MLVQLELVTIVIVVVFFCLSLVSFALKFFSNYGLDMEAKENSLRQRLCDLRPEALCSDSDLRLVLPERSGKIETFTVDEVDEQGLDLVKVNYLNMLNNQRIKELAIECIRKYGVGTCGPRAFFGTTEVHLELETQLANFLGMEEAIIYSYGFAAPSNSILAYCKKTDVIFCDEKINFALEQGVLAARSVLVYFKHNNVTDLLQKLEEASKKDSPMSHMRKFLLIEGIYAKTGAICPLPELIRASKLYKARIFLDETISFGVLGERGCGVTDHYGVGVEEIDMIIGSLEGAIGSIGSFCASSKSVVEHQRLASIGYVFSASLPTFQAQAAIEALRMIENSPEEIFHLQLLSRKVHKFLNASLKFIVHSDPISPHKVFTFKPKQRRRQAEREICDFCHARGVYLIANEHGLVMNLNVSLYYQKTKLLNVFAVLDCAANTFI